MFQMTIRTETPAGEFKTTRTVKATADEVAAERAHQRTLVTRGATQTIEVKALKR